MNAMEKILLCLTTAGIGYVFTVMQFLSGGE